MSPSSLQFEPLPGRCRSFLREIPSAHSSSSRARPVDGPRKPLAASSIDRVAAIWSLTSTPHAKPHGNVRSPAILPCPRPNADEGAVCAPGYRGRKRGEVVRTRTTALQMHTRQWIGTYAGKGNGDYRGELDSALRAITAYLKHFAFPKDVALVRLDGAYGDATVLAQLLLAGTHFVTRWRGYQLLERPQIQLVLAHAPTVSVTRINSGEVVELFDGGWLDLGEGLSRVRVMVARHPAPPPEKHIPVGKRVGEWVYELFITTLGADGFLVEDVLDLYQGRGAFEAVLADEDIEEDPDRWCSYTECGQELWQIAWECRVEPAPLAFRQTMQAGRVREIEWAPPKEAPAFFSAEETPPEEYGPWQWAAAFGRASGRFGAEDFVLQEDGKLRCPAGASLWLSEVRQENAFTQRAVYLAYQTDCLPCALREQCLAKGG